MTQRHILFVPGKNPKPPAAQHKSLLWRTLIEGVRRVDSEIANNLSQHPDNFKLIAWNYLYYKTVKDINRDLPWIDALINKHGPSELDIKEAKSSHKIIHQIIYNIFDHFPFLLNLFPGVLKATADEINRYFNNKNNIACEVREQLKKELRPLFDSTDKILVIAHSMGSIIAYDTLWELSHLENHPNKIDLFLTIGSPLGMNYVQRRLMGNPYTGMKKYPTNIKHWVNISSTGDITALNHIFANDFSEMRKLNIIDSIEDHCEGIFNFFHNEDGLNCHRSYGYLVNPAIGKVIADWWQSYNISEK